MKQQLTLLLAATAIVAAGCTADARQVETSSDDAYSMSTSDSTAKAAGLSQVRVVNAVAGGKDIAVMIGEVALFDTVAPGVVTGYRETALNLARFTVQPAGLPDGIMVAEKDRLLLDGSRYTVFLIADDISRHSLMVVRDIVSPDSGKARIRVIHAAYGAPVFDIGVMGSQDRLFTGMTFKSGGEYKDVPPATMSLSLIASNGDGKVLLSIPDLTLVRGTATTLVITGASKLAYFKFSDELVSPAKQ